MSEDAASLQNEMCSIFEDRLQRAQCAEVVQTWCDYVRWAGEHLNNESSAAILRRACFALASDPRHQDDVRQVRLWVMHAQGLPDPQCTFQFLHSEGIGLGHALLYEAWAAALELKRLHAEAEAVYSKGLAHGAEPHGRLESRFADFQHRMRKRERRQKTQNRAPSNCKGQATDLPALQQESSNFIGLAAHSPALRQEQPAKCIGPVTDLPALQQEATSNYIWQATHSPALQHEASVDCMEHVAVVQPLQQEACCALAPLDCMGQIANVHALQQEAMAPCSCIEQVGGLPAPQQAPLSYMEKKTSPALFSHGERRNLSAEFSRLDQREDTPALQQGLDSPALQKVLSNCTELPKELPALQQVLSDYTEQVKNNIENEDPNLGEVLEAWVAPLEDVSVEELRAQMVLAHFVVSGEDPGTPQVGDGQLQLQAKTLT